MTYRIILTSRAEDDSNHGYIWWAINRSPEQASRWFKKLQQILDNLELDPERYGRAPESAGHPDVLREVYFGVGRRKTHRLIFKIRGNEVEVVAVRHLAQDFAPIDDV